MSVGFNEASLYDYRVFSEEEFKNMSSTGGLIIVIPLSDDHWCIEGTGGMYESTDHKREFNLNDVHSILKKWGVKKYIQDGHVKQFD
ncbi:MAG: hypothetical protein ACXVNF_15935, partial [Neobacillus sp.]